MSARSVFHDGCESKGRLSNNLYPDRESTAIWKWWGPKDEKTLKFRWKHKYSACRVCFPPAVRNVLSFFLFISRPSVRMAKDQTVVWQQWLSSSGSRKVSLISSPCDGVSSQDPDRAIVPLPGPEWRMTAPSHWRKWGGQRRTWGHIFTKTLFSSTYLLVWKCQIFHNSPRDVNANLDVAAVPQGSLFQPG